MSFWNSLLVSKRKEEEGAGSAPTGEFVGLGDGRKQAWKSFMNDLEDDCDDELAAPTVAPTAVDPPPRAAAGDSRGTSAATTPFTPALQSLYMQQLVDGTRTRPEEPRLEITTPPSVRTLPPTMPLSDWVAYQTAETRQQRVAPFGRVMGIDKSYLEKSTCVALSLAQKLAEHHANYALLQEEDIILGKVTVTNTTDGAADFVTVSEASTLSDGARPQPGRPTSQRPAIAALGRIFYELFTQGWLPLSPEQEEASHPDVPSSDGTDFAVALQIAEDDTPPEEEDEIGNRRKQPRRTRTDDHYSRLRDRGVPPSLCRLVAHMLDNETTATRGLFLHDRAVARLSDVACDLRQMVDDPRSFLHDSLLLRLEPVVPDKMYGRGEELRRCVEVAATVSRVEDRPSARDYSQQSAIMISGFSGSGKTNLVKEVETLLEKKGWRFLRCKFDQETRPQPLSAITSAFDRFLVDIMGRLDHDGQQEFKVLFVHMFSTGDIETLCTLVPSLRKWATMIENSTQPVEPSKPSFNNIDFAKCRLHNLFGLLTKALSGRAHPLLFVMDDLQWADMASLNLLYSLVEGTSAEGGSDVLFVGCYRSNEVTASDPLATCIQQMKDCHAIMMTEIHLEGLSGDDINALVSDALFYPRRLTLPLSNLIHQKSAGNPLYLREFLSELASANLLTYSLSKHQWKFDEDLIQLKVVSEGVADLLARRLKRLPEGVLSGLEIMSCFGSEVTLDILYHVNHMCHNSDILSMLDLATKELLVKKANGSYCFNHDAIQQAVYWGIVPQARVLMLNEIADTLIAKTEDGRSDAVLFIIVDLINRVGPTNAPSCGDQTLLYARLNLSAGEKSIHTPDYASAYEYVQSGISFLGSDYWRDQYDLSLALFNASALVCWALGKTNAATERTNELLDNARRFEDTIESKLLMVQVYEYRGDSVDKGFALCFDVLAQLGESFPTSIEDGYIVKELTSTHQHLQKLLPASLDSLPMMEDKQKLQAMNFLMIAAQLCFQRKSPYYPIVSCRLVRLTISYGLSEYSAIGLASVAIALSSVMKQRTEAYTLGQLARRLNQSLKVPSTILHKAEVELTVVSMVNIWKEPLQVLLPSLLDYHKILLKAGEVSTACLFAASYVYRAFVAGSALSSLSRETIAFLRVMSRYKRISIYLTLLPVSNTMAALTGTKRILDDNVEGCGDDEQNLISAMSKSDIYVAEIIVIQKMIVDFIFRRMAAAEKLVKQYTEFFELHKSVPPLNMIYRSFYTGLVAFHFLRESPQEHQYWTDLGRCAIQKFEQWTMECEWNFSNKLCLLNAEYYFALGEVEAASKHYQLAIASARSHRFKHEEAVACELASLFHLKTGKKDVSRDFLKQSVACYKLWGAEQKANTLLQSWND